MNRIKFNDLISILVAIILMVQVALSYTILTRLNQLETGLAQIPRSAAGGQIPAPVYIADISVDDDYSKGTKGAPITIVEFSDYQCPFCQSAEPYVDDLLSKYGDQIYYVYRDFPLEHVHPDAYKAAEAANCAGEQSKYWEMHDLLFENQDRLDLDSIKSYAAQLDVNSTQFNECLESGKYADEVKNDMEDGNEYQVSGTPTFFVNGNRVMNYNELETQVETILEDLRR